jgi:uncharacterized protein
MKQTNCLTYSAMNKPYYSVSDFYRNRFGVKVYKLALDAGCTCPTRDGTKDSRGCIFCSVSGSGDFAASSEKSITEQILDAKKLVGAKCNGRSAAATGKFIAYFQNFTNTYGDHEQLEKKYREAACAGDIVGVAIATRPDCLDDDILSRIQSLSRETFVSLELGLQTVHEITARYIRRGYDCSVYDEAVARIHAVNPDIHVVTQVIFGLPGETEDDMMRTIDHVVQSQSDGIKITVLYVLEGTDLAAEYRNGQFSCMTKDAYFHAVAQALLRIPADRVIHRLTGDGPKRILIDPLWTADKKRVCNDMSRYLSDHGILQGNGLSLTL